MRPWAQSAPIRSRSVAARTRTWDRNSANGIGWSALARMAVMRSSSEPGAGVTGSPPAEDLGRAAQRLPGAYAAATLPGMMDDEHGGAVAALQFAQEGQQRRDLTAGVLVDAMQAHERIENKQARQQASDGVGEVPPVGVEIEAQDGRGDDLDIEVGERQPRCGADAFRRTMCRASSAANSSTRPAR